MPASAPTPATDPFLAMLQTPDYAPMLHALRSEDPVHFVAPLGFWLVTRHDDVKRLFNDPENATQDRSAFEHFVPAPEGSMLRWLEDRRQTGFGDPEAHARFRRLFSATLTPRAVRRMEGLIREVVERYAAPLRGRRGEVLDLMADFTTPIPNAVISRITGVPPGDDEVRFRMLAQALIRAFFPFASGDAIEQGDAALREMSAWVRALAAERRREPKDDLISDLIRNQAEGGELSDDDIVILISVLIGAGSETTNLGGAVTIRTLLEHPEALARVGADRALVPNAVNEVLRFAFGGPAGILRYAVRDFALRGRTIRKGQMIMLSLGGANRDPAVFAEPDRFDLDRDTRETLVFGSGPHYCLGASLARQELGCMLEAVLDIAPPGSRVRDDLVRTQAFGLVAQPVSLPVEIAAA